MEDREELVQQLRQVQTIAVLVGDSPIFQHAIRNLPAIAKQDATVLVSGESGTGKEVVARAIHYMGPRAAGPFVAVNCGSIPDTLFEEEVFGHERGAFTDAHSSRLGLFAQGEKGTVFLDEIDALSLRAQIALLRVLQDRRFRPIGGTREQTANVRFVAATNASLEQLVEKEKFRADLYYRICILAIRLPPLRERKEDLPALAAHFIQKHASASQGELRLSEDAVAALKAHHWPGNLRELENAIIRGLAYRRSNCIQAADLELRTMQPDPESFTAVTGGPMKAVKREMIESFERQYLKRLMQAHHGNVTEAARSAGKERRELGKLLRKYDLNPRDI
jgi:DNA-binding NtrC family response regulator